MCGTELTERPEAVQRVMRALEQAGSAVEPRWLDGDARTAQQAADALGVQLGQIAKSVIFKRLPDEVAVLVVTSGDLRVAEALVVQQVCAVGQTLARADAAFVKATTGFAIGGVSPIGHVRPPVVVLDEQLKRFAHIWAAAGHPKAVMCLTPTELQRLTHAEWDAVTEPNPQHEKNAEVKHGK